MSGSQGDAADSVLMVAILRVVLIGQSTGADQQATLGHSRELSDFVSLGTRSMRVIRRSLQDTYWSSTLQRLSPTTCRILRISF